MVLIVPSQQPNSLGSIVTSDVYIASTILMLCILGTSIGIKYYNVIGWALVLSGLWLMASVFVLGDLGEPALMMVSLVGGGWTIVGSFIYLFLMGRYVRTLKQV